MAVHLRAFYKSKDLYGVWFPTLASLGFELTALDEGYKLSDGPPGLDIEIMSSTRLRHSVPVVTNTATMFVDGSPNTEGRLIVCTPIPDFKQMSNSELGSTFEKLWKSGVVLNTNPAYEKWAWGLVCETLRSAISKCVMPVTLGFCCETSGLATGESASAEVRVAFSQEFGRFMADLPTAI